MAWLKCLICFLAAALSWKGKSISATKLVCEPINIPLCLHLGYNMTTMPNHMGHDNQLEARSRIEEFKPLANLRCAPNVRHFICSAFAPMCSPDVEYPVVACRSMCEEAKKGCSAFLEKFGYKWPESLKCEGFPVHSQKGTICIEAPKGSTVVPLINLNSTLTDILKYNRSKPIPIPSRSMPSSGGDNLKHDNCINTKKFVWVEKKRRCAAKCGADIYFNKTNKHFSDVWLLIWSTICFISTMLTVFTYLVDRSRFKYPERPIIYFAFCYNLYSVAYLIRLIAKPEGISCSANGEHLIMDGLNTAGCSIVFFLLYFFGMASSLWWVILTLTWFLSAALKWSQEAIASKSTYFHAIAWAIPTIQTITALSTRKVDADELTGLCYVGNQNVESLAGFVLAPLCIYLVVGTTFLLAGFISLFRIRSVLKDHDTNTHKLEKLMVRIGVFSVLYTLPATAVIACFVYEYSNMEAWRKDVQTNCIDVLTDECNLAIRPKEEIYMVRHFMSLVVGITSGMWVWSTKTCQSWQLCYNRNFSSSYKRQPLRKQPLLVQITTENTAQIRPPTVAYSDQCGTSNVSHPITHLSTPTNEPGQRVSVPV